MEPENHALEKEIPSIVFRFHVKLQECICHMKWLSYAFINFIPSEFCGHLHHTNCTKNSTELDKQRLSKQQLLISGKTIENPLIWVT